MADTFNPLAGLQNFFFAGDKADPRVNQQLRQKIALAMMQRQSKFPKTLGEGLSAIGEAIGDRGLTNSLLSGDLAQQDAAARTAAGIAPAGSQTSATETPQRSAPTRRLRTQATQRRLPQRTHQLRRRQTSSPRRD